LLCQIAEWMANKARGGQWLARIGPNQFAALVPVNAQGNLTRFLEKSLEELSSHTFHLDHGALRLAMRGGAALFPQDGRTADVLLGNAEAALKAAKLQGHHYLFHQASMTDKVASNLILENQLREALEKEQFVLHYQPKVNLATGLITGAEALIRWNDPKTGLVPPFRFIPVLEETGLIHKVGRWAMRKAVDEVLRWRDMGFHIGRIAVNVSALQLRNAGFIAEIAQLVAIDARAAGGLELEITESMVMNDIARGIESLTAIRAMGITVSIDDFGTGFSSLAYLAKLPIDTLKIDRTFITDMVASPAGLALVSAMISMAQALQLKVVAEGVETDEQARMLRLLRCDEMQGYLFSKPLPFEEFEQRFLLAKSKP
jgi:EAL domain-containing protein (putative c-di-GMP-specific phosphodiesterase class I)